MKLTPEQQQQITAILPHAEKVAGKLCPGDDEAMSVVRLAICEAIQKYDPARGTTIKTFCLNEARHAVLHYNCVKRGGGKENGFTKKSVCEFLTQPERVMSKPDDGPEWVDIEDLLSVLPKRYANIFRQVVFENVAVADIARVEGCSASRIYKIMSVCKERLRRELDG